MRVSRWRRSLGPPLLVAAATALLAGPPSGPSEPSPTAQGPRLVAAAGGDLPACGARGQPIPPTDLPGAAWYRLDPLLDASGQLAGQRLEAGLLGSLPTTVLALDPESFAAGPSRGQVVVGTDDGRRSLVRIVDAGRGCEVIVHDGPSLVRRAVLDPDGRSLVEFRLDRWTRADLGVWRRPLEGGAPGRILEPLPPNERLGLIFSTELSWTADGRLVVVSCGESACLTRILDPTSGEVRAIDDPHVGEPIGVLGDRLVGYAECPALPCPLVSHDLASGATRQVAPLTGLAVLAAGGQQVVYEDHAAGGLRAVVDDSRPRPMKATAGSLRIVPSGPRAGAAVELPRGWIALALDGRPAGGQAEESAFVRLADGHVVSAGEVSR